MKEKLANVQLNENELVYVINVLALRPYNEVSMLIQRLISINSVLKNQNQQGQNQEQTTQG